MITIDELRKIMQNARKSGDKELLSNVSLIIGELDRNLDNTEKDIISTLKKLKKLEIEMLSYKNEKTSSFLSFIESLLPSQIEPEEIKIWIDNNIDFSTLKNKMQAVGIVMKHFGQKADGQIVKNIIGDNY